MLATDNDDIDNDFASKIWEMEKSMRGKTNDNNNEHEVLRLICLCLTDYLAMCYRSTFRVNHHERTFWVERIVPFFKYLDTTTNVVFSLYSHGKSVMMNVV